MEEMVFKTVSLNRSLSFMSNYDVDAKMPSDLLLPAPVFRFSGPQYL